jgi:pyruvate kinase
VHTTVKLGGELSNNKGINKQGGGLTAPALTAKDMEDIKTAMSFQADYVAVSFPKNATDMEMARQLCNVAAAEYRHKPGLIAKIERAEAIPQPGGSSRPPATASWWRAATWRWKWATPPCPRCKSA